MEKVLGKIKKKNRFIEEMEIIVRGDQRGNPSSHLEVVWTVIYIKRERERERE